MTAPSNVLDETLNHERVADRVLYALELAIDQKDLEISERLSAALDIAMTRNSGGGEFVERRNYPERIQKTLSALDDLRS